MLGQTFRIDLFGKDLDAARDPQAARMAGWWAATTTEADADFTLASPAGTVVFDDAAARGVLAALAHGPRRLADIAASLRGEGDAELLYAIDALWTSGQILPCDPPLDSAGARAGSIVSTSRPPAAGRRCRRWSGATA